MAHCASMRFQTVGKISTPSLEKLYPKAGSKVG